MNTTFCHGYFHGADLEPGTFHAHGLEETSAEPRRDDGDRTAEPTEEPTDPSDSVTEASSAAA